MKFRKNYFSICLLLCCAFEFFSCVTIPNDQRIDDIPMYGQPDISRPLFMKKLDQDFIKKAASGFGGNRKEASRAWAAVADDFLNNGNIHYAMRRYNQSWLLDPDSYKPYWGFGQIMVIRKKYDDAILYLEKAKKLIDDPYQKVALLVDAAIAYSYKAQSFSDNQTEERKRYFAIANSHFKESTILEETFPKSWQRWAYSLYDEGNYSEAWEKIEKARSLGADPYPKAFIDDLNSKMPEPK